MAKKKTYSKEDHEIFKAALRETDSARHSLAIWLRLRGWQVKPLLPLEVAENAEDWGRLADSGDVIAYKAASPETLVRFEVKQLGTFFHGAEDWPFDYAIVCKRSTWERAFPKPAWVICFNPRRTAAILIDGSTAAKWETRKIKDSRHRNVSQEFLTCPLSLCRWEQLPEECWRTDIAGIPPRTCCHADVENWIDRPADTAAGQIKTVCKICGGFIGYRPTAAAPRPAKKSADRRTAEKNLG